MQVARIAPPRRSLCRARRAGRRGGGGRMRVWGVFVLGWIFTLIGWCGRQESGRGSRARGKDGKFEGNGPNVRGGNIGSVDSGVLAGGNSQISTKKVSAQPRPCRSVHAPMRCLVL